MKKKEENTYYLGGSQQTNSQLVSSFGEIEQKMSYLSCFNPPKPRM